MPLGKKVTLASFQENILVHKTVFLSLYRSLWEDQLLYTLIIDKSNIKQSWRDSLSVYLLTGDD